MRNVFKFILYIFLIIAIILVVAWMRARKTAQEGGSAAPSFRQFIGLGPASPTQPGDTPGTGLTADFTEPDAAGEPIDPSMSIDSGSVAVSQFTTSTQSPTQYPGPSGSPSPLPGGTGSSSNSLAGGSLSSGSLAPGSGLPIAAPAPTATLAYQCTDADLNIQFTAEEITRLNALQNRFYAIAGILRTDADIQLEVVNHDEFKSKVDQITELYNYCAAKSPLLASSVYPLYTSRVTTPYWRDASRDGIGYISRRFNGWDWIQLDSRKWDPDQIALSKAVIEQIFKLNLW